MKTYTITVNGKAYAVTVEEGAAAPVAAVPVAAPHLWQHPQRHLRLQQPPHLRQRLRQHLQQPRQAQQAPLR